MFKFETIEVTPFQQNARLLYCPDSNQAVVIDPGGDADLILSRAEKNNLTIEQIWLTHSHLDHCGGVADLKEATGATLLGHEIERPMRERVLEICRMYGLPAGGMKNCPEPDRYIKGGDTVTLSSYSFEVMFTPGHAPGHLCFYYEPGGVLFCGDTVFAGSIGRTDLPGGSHQQLIHSIKENILVLPDETRLFPGHGPETTVGREKLSNPFLQE